MAITSLGTVAEEIDEVFYNVNLGKSIGLATLEFFESVLDARNVSYILIHRTPDYIEIDSDNDGCDDIVECGSSDETDHAY